MRPRTYLDFNATTPLRPEARAAVLSALDCFGNPSSVHAEGRAARRVLEKAREQVAFLCRSQPSELVFTSGGTEANRLALSAADPSEIIVSALEHDSILAVCPQSWQIPVESDGRIDLNAAAAIFHGAPPPRLISLMLVNNETGVIQPVVELATLARQHGCLVHCDATQAAGRLKIDVATLGVDLLTLSAHKIGGPKGVGALFIREGLTIRPLFQGGNQEARRRAGTENLPAIAGFGAAAELARQAVESPEIMRIEKLRDRLESALTTSAPRAVIPGSQVQRVVNTSCIAVPNLPSHTQVMALDLAGIAVSAGAACSSGKVQVSHVLQAMGLPPDLCGSAIRVSLGWTTTEAEIEHFVNAWTSLYERHMRLSAAA